MIRSARLADIAALLAIEDEAFLTDRLTRRKLRHLLTDANAGMLVTEVRGVVAGYALILYRRGVAGARLYGIAVERTHRGRGLGRKLLAASVRAARRRGCRWLRLEVAESNLSAIRFYETAGFTLLKRLGTYYEDGAPARRYAKALVPSK